MKFTQFSTAVTFRTILGLGLTFATMVSGAQAQQVADADLIPYDTVEQVFDAMEADENAARTDYGGWIIYNIANQGSYTLWSITPEDHPANPTAIRRDVVKRDGILSIQMQALCQAAKVECDNLIAEFKEINAGIKQKMESGNSG